MVVILFIFFFYCSQSKSEHEVYDTLITFYAALSAYKKQKNN